MKHNVRFWPTLKTGCGNTVGTFWSRKTLWSGKTSSTFTSVTTCEHNKKTNVWFYEHNKEIDEQRAKNQNHKKTRSELLGGHEKNNSIEGFTLKKINRNWSLKLFVRVSDIGASGSQESVKRYSSFSISIWEKGLRSIMGFTTVIFSQGI